MTEKLCGLAAAWSILLGRLCLAGLFLQSGIDKLLHFDKTLKLMASKAMPIPEILLPPAIAILLAGGVMLLAGWKARWGALALIVFMIPATLVFHSFWTYPEAQFVNQFHHFFKNIAIIGGLLLIVGMGPGRMSIDRSGDR
ncbi:MAG: DoxX family protein [Burkholderiales bacterium]|nr:DoxX family protein [Burkholderiales bacterium]